MCLRSKGQNTALQQLNAAQPFDEAVDIKENPLLESLLTPLFNYLFIHLFQTFVTHTIKIE